MTESPRLLVTNDDGIDHPGLGALVDSLSTVADVTVVAPEEDHSGCARRQSRSVRVSEHDRGHAVSGTPCDCVVYGVEGPGRRPDMVVSGCNAGPNIGQAKIDRSGTVAAAVEAALLGVPAIAVSAYDPGTCRLQECRPADFRPAAEVTRGLVARAVESDPFDGVDLLNVNVPTDAADEVRVTRPIEEYGLEVSRDGDTASFYKTFYDPLNAADPGALLERRGERWTDRRALADGVVSVSPLVGGREVSTASPLGGVGDELDLGGSVRRPDAGDDGGA